MGTSDAPATRFTASGIEYLDFGTGPQHTVERTRSRGGML
jgi:hypothetical protein